MKSTHTEHILNKLCQNGRFKWVTTTEGRKYRNRELFPVTAAKMLVTNNWLRIDNTDMIKYWNKYPNQNMYWEG